MAREKPVLPPRTVWGPTPYELADAGAFQALQRGEATPDQQIRALKWLVYLACETYEPSYRPTGDRDTSFAEGKRWVGLQVVKLCGLPLSKLKKDQE
jgi:hypothetical protein